jgi:hypothetical protein
MTNPRLLAKKVTRARQIARRCAEATVMPPKWVLHLLRPKNVTITIGGLAA